jgi:hypothetical protein
LGDDQHWKLKLEDFNLYDKIETWNLKIENCNFYLKIEIWNLKTAIFIWKLKTAISIWKLKLETWKLQFIFENWNLKLESCNLYLKIESWKLKTSIETLKFNLKTWNDSFQIEFNFQIGHYWFSRKTSFRAKKNFFKNDLLMLPDDRGHSVAYKKLF